MRPSDSPSNDLQITFCSMPASEVLQKKYAKLAISNVQTSIVNHKSNGRLQDDYKGPKEILWSKLFY